jgi:cellulose biosynthesis protein BcsQ
MPTPVEITVADELIVAVILESWSIEELRQLIEEIDAELRSRPTH